MFVGVNRPSQLVYSFRPCLCFDVLSTKYDGIQTRNGSSYAKRRVLSWRAVACMARADNKKWGEIAAKSVV